MILARRVLGAALLMTLILGIHQAAGQTVLEEWAPAQGHLRIGPEPERRIPMSDVGHVLLIPERPPVGVVAFLDSRRFPEWVVPPEGSFDAEALDRSLAVLHITTGDPLDFLFDESDLRSLATRLNRVLGENGLLDRPVHMAGLSLGGTRALRLRMFLEQHAAQYDIIPGSVAVVDAPLDMERLWHSEGSSIIRDHHPAAADEGRWVRYLLESNLGGTPADARGRYVEYSPFTYSEPGGGSAVHLRDVPLRAYQEPDIDWWIEHRGKSYYDMNSLDLAALIGELRASGNTRAWLVTSHGERAGYEADSSPHTWSFVDDVDLAEWFVTMSGGVK